MNRERRIDREKERVQKKIIRLCKEANSIEALGIITEWHVAELKKARQDYCLNELGTEDCLVLQEVLKSEKKRREAEIQKARVKVVVLENFRRWLAEELLKKRKKLIEWKRYSDYKDLAKIGADLQHLRALLDCARALRGREQNQRSTVEQQTPS